MSWRHSGVPFFSTGLGKFGRPRDEAQPRRRFSQRNRPPLHRSNVGWFRSELPFPEDLGKKRMLAIRKGKKRVRWAPPGSLRHHY